MPRLAERLHWLVAVIMAGWSLWRGLTKQYLQVNEAYSSLQCSLPMAQDARCGVLSARHVNQSKYDFRFGGSGSALPTGYQRSPFPVSSNPFSRIQLLVIRYIVQYLIVQRATVAMKFL